MKQTNYKTKQKTAILQCVKNMGDKHFTIDALCEILIKNGNAVGRTTVYRMLEKLSEDGILRKFVMPQGESSCYQYVGDHNHCHEHFHLKCEKCGSLIHMDCDEMNSLAEHIKSHHGFSLNPLKTVIYGVCEGCAEK
ncbi:MAG: transcriptional repressor [Clostridia bacterium]|nr:transcriptional repressor [Clostridia bacterium]